MDQAEGLRTLMKNGCREKGGSRPIVEVARPTREERCPKVLSVASGKGGVGKTNLVANLGFAFTQLGKRILILDADLGLANIDVLLGLAPRYTIEHLFNRTKTFSELLIKGPGGMSIMPASSGVLDLVDLKEEQKLFLLNEVDLMADQIDLLLIDTGAGISSNVLYFNMAAQESIVIVTPEPTSITDAYAFIKVLSVRFKKRRFMILVNLVETDQEAREVFRKISLVADRYLEQVSIDYLGFIPVDEKLPWAVKQQRAVLELYPKAPSSRGFMDLARRLAERPVQFKGDGQIQFFWKQLLQCHTAWDHKGEIG
jgi:flagellar biosynthesis protein FlhG